ncbi:NAD(P)-binding domain-containing protein [Rhodoglobus vestalii]|uniref:NAD(P)-binding domain-containing protein n=1 Tax=Rhodoglobus vestalii TaxID=193384 RepID=UPI0011545237|nr:NAD(P)-binding domain-containing protein [Rhodoglobus vestalii]
MRRRHTDWDEAPKQATFSRAGIINRAEKIRAAVEEVTGSSDHLGVDAAFEETRSFVDTAFDIYEGKIESEQYGWVFAVPGRNETSQGNEYETEVTPFLPILSSVYGVDDKTRQHTTARLAPCVIETHKGRASMKGAVVWTPLYVNAATRLDTNLWRRFVVDNTAGIRHSVNRTAEFAAHRLGARVMGLGASIPSFTQLGKSIKQEGLITTTGHAGTVHLLNETVRHVVETRGTSEKTIGLLGAGSIGSSWAELHLLTDRKHRVSVYDRNHSQVDRLRRKVEQERVDVESHEFNVLESSDIIVSAINRTLDLDEMEYQTDRQISLQGKVIIDDSQPGAFDRKQVEARGGTLIWVVGQDTSDAQALHRPGGYSFGDTAGLHGKGAVWGCEAEVAAICLEDRLDLAVSSHVTHEMATNIGALCHSIGVEVARPLQSFGAPVQLNSESWPRTRSGSSGPIDRNWPSSRFAP